MNKDDTWNRQYDVIKSNKVLNNIIYHSISVKRFKVPFSSTLPRTQYLHSEFTNYIVSPRMRVFIF